MGSQPVREVSGLSLMQPGRTGPHVASSQVQEAGFQTCKRSSSLWGLEGKCAMTATLHHNTFQRLPQIVAWPLFTPTPSANNAQGSHWGGSCTRVYTFKMITSLNLPLMLLLLKHAQSFLCAQPLIRDDCVPNSWKSRTRLLTHRLKYIFLNYICCPPHHD